MTSLEKLFFQTRFQCSITLLSLAGALIVSCESIERTGHGRWLADLDAQSREALSQLADVVSLWRSQLLTEMEKMTVQELTEPFFRQLVSALLELDAPREALVAIEKSRARALVDLLAVQPELQERLDDFLRQELQMISPTSAEGLSFEDIRALLRRD